MSKKTMLDMMGGIDDAFIEEAAHPELLLMGNRRRQRMQLVRRAGTLAACLVLAVGLVVAVPYMERIQVDNTVKDVQESDSNDEIRTEGVNDAVQSNQIEMDASLSAVISSQQAAEESIKAAAEAASKEAAASAASKAAQEAAALAASKAAQAAENVSSANRPETSRPDSATTKIPESSGQASAEASKANESQLTSHRFGSVIFHTDSSSTLFGFQVDADHTLKELVIPEKLNGEAITEIDTVFWRFCQIFQPERIVIPASIVSFGNVGLLDRNAVVICCPKNSEADVIFSGLGYTVVHS